MLRSGASATPERLLVHLLAAVAFFFSKAQIKSLRALIHYTCTCKPSPALVSTIREAISDDLVYAAHIKTELLFTSKDQMNAWM